MTPFGILASTTVDPFPVGLAIDTVTASSQLYPRSSFPGPRAFSA